jgi:hypothetical protein
MNFRKLTIDDYDLFMKYSSDDINFENNFVINFIWGVHFPCEIAEFENALMFKVMTGGSKIIFDTPKTKDICLDKYLLAAASYCRENHIPLSFKILAKDYENLSPQIKSDFAYEPIPNQWDYIYNAADLIEFKGRKFHNKRNLLSQFVRNYKYNFIDFDRDKHLESLITFQERWSKANIDNIEMQPFKCALDNLEKLKLNLDIIECGGQIIAFSVSCLNHNAGEIIFEKGDTNFKGVYAAIVNFSVQKHFQNCAYINREEDMGFENLRKSKLSFNPVKQIEKYLIHFK